MGGFGNVRRSGWAAGALLILFLSCGFAASAEDGPRLVYADNGSWETDLLVTTFSGDTPARVHGTNCPFGPSGFDVSVGPDESAVIENFGGYLCGERIGLVPYETGGSPFVSVYARYRDSEGNVTAFEIPPLRYQLRAGETAEAPLIRVTDEHDTAVVIFNEGKYTAVRATVFDGANEPLGVEVFDVPAGLTLYQVSTPVGIGRLELAQGLPIGCGGCSFDEPLYGFVAVGVRGGGSQRVIPLAPKLRFTTE
jgi:hypothetical protein